MVRKFLFKINVSLLVLIITSLFCSCTGEMNILEGDNNEQINFSVSIPSWKSNDSKAGNSTKSETRSTPITDASLGTDKTFGIIADIVNGSNYTTEIDQEVVLYNTTNKIWETVANHYWPGANKTVNFYAYYPASITNGTMTHTAGTTPTLTYTVPAVAATQADIITSTSTGVSGTTYSSTSVSFKHILAAVKFNVGTSGMPSGTIKSISITGVKTSGTYTFNGGWVLGSTSTDVTTSPSTAITGASGTSITSGTYTLMMIPQTFTKATITVTYSNGTVFSKTISDTWAAGNTYTYNLSKTVICNYDYTGSVQTFTAPYTGTYKIECWGASGGCINSYMGGKGAYTEGSLFLINNKSIFLYVGGEGSNDINGSFNGGGGLSADIWGRSGGGATDIRLVSGSWGDFESLKSRIMVAAGGGGANDRNYTETGTPFGCGDGGFGGSLIGGNGFHVPNSSSEGWFCLTYGATQTFGGTGIEYKDGGATNYNSGVFGNVILNGAISQGGGGGGYYGGANSYAHCGGSGGSSFISGYTGCNAIDKLSTSDHIIHTGSPNHYSGYIFTNSQMIAGDTSMPKPTGGTETGHSGNGYTRITFVSAN